MLYCFCVRSKWEKDSAEGVDERWVRARWLLSVIGNLYFCRPYLSSALTPCFCAESQPMGHPDRLDRATRGRRAACRTWDAFNLCRHRWPLLRWWSCRWPQHRHHRRFQSNLQYRILRVPFASPRGWRVVALSRNYTAFPPMSTNFVCYTTDRSLAHRECCTRRKLVRAIAFLIATRRTRRFVSPFIVFSILSFLSLV